jgi:hypothetical protein
MDMGFDLNPYGACVAHAMIDASHCTITWYVNDNKNLHINLEVVSTIIQKIEEQFGKMTVTCGKQCTSQGMDFLYNNNETFTVKMGKSLQETITKSNWT